MRKLLFAFCLFVAFIGCSDDDEKMGNPIQDLQLPSASETYVSGQSVTIQGKGFNSDSRIWLRAAEDQAQGDVLATIESVNENSITFIVPGNIDGKQQIVLKQSGLEYVLGTLNFKKVTEKLCSLVWDDVNCGMCELDIENKTYRMFLETEELPEGIATTNEGKIYYDYTTKSGEVSYIGCYDLKAHENKIIVRKWKRYSTRDGEEYGEGVALGIIDNKLHGVKYNDTKGYYLVSIEDNGQETEIATFGKIAVFEEKELFADDLHFDYDPIHKTILISGDLDKTGHGIASLNLQNNSVQALKDSEGIIEVLNVKNKWYLFHQRWDMVNNVTVTNIDPLTLQKVQTICELSVAFEDVFYWKNKDLILGFNGDKGPVTLSSLNFETGQCTAIWDEVEFDNLFTVTY